MKVFLRLFFVSWIFFFAFSEEEIPRLSSIENRNLPVTLVQFNNSFNDDAIQNQHSFEVFSNSNFVKENSRSLSLLFSASSNTIRDYIVSKVTLLKIQSANSITFYFTNLQLIFPFHYFW